MIKEPFPSVQRKHGKAHFTYYDIVNTLSFAWDGESSDIEVLEGRMGNEVIDTIDISSTRSRAEGDTIFWLNWFKTICINYIQKYERDLTA